MTSNTFGRLFRLTTFGESHGPALGGIVDGCPAGLPLSESHIQQELDKRKPGEGIASTKRKEPDTVSLQSGVFEGRTTGTAIGFCIANTDQRSGDYHALKDVYRPGHADMTYDAKFGIRDFRGGGRSSGRETVSRVAGGAIAQILLATCGITLTAATTTLGGIAAEQHEPWGAQDRAFFATDSTVIPLWEKRVKEVHAQGDTLGGIVEIRAAGVPAGLGEPVFDKLDARLAAAMMSVGAVKGVEIGSGMAAADSYGSENNDTLLPDGFGSNHAGGILGGISSGQEILVRVAVKPIASVARPQQTITRNGQQTTVTVGGRHDIAAIPRINPVLKAMAALTLADMLLLQQSRTGARKGCP